MIYSLPTGVKLKMNKKIIAAIILMLLYGLSCASEQKQQQLEGPVDEKGGRCIKGNCHYGVGTYVFPNGNRYEGDFRCNVPFGIGTMYYKNGLVLKGKWKWGKPDLR